MRIPSIHAKGRFVLKSPFAARTDLLYEVTAIREFKDLYFQGIDVYATFYESKGLRENVNLNGETFKFENEVNNNVMIITLEGSDGSIIYVPTSYIVSFPNAADVEYSRVLLSLDLGSIPDTVELSHLMNEVSQLVSSKVGIQATAKLHKGPATRQPTPEEHDVLESTRIGNINNLENLYSQNEKLKNQVTMLQNQINTMVSILRENNLL